MFYITELRPNLDKSQNETYLYFELRTAWECFRDGVREYSLVPLCSALWEGQRYILKLWDEENFIFGLYCYYGKLSSSGWQSSDKRV